MNKAVQLVKRLQNSQVHQLPPFASYGGTAVAAHLRQLMIDNLTIADLKNVAPEQFQSYITSLPGQRDAAMEGYCDPTYQRDLSVQFEWGNTHDFGSFHMPGQMKNRHIDILATFMSVYDTPDIDLRGKTVLDIGCWTGGTSLLSAAMGAEVFAIGEVRKYVDVVNYLKDAFGLDNLQVERLSPYSLDDQEFFDRFDLVLYFGVLYHVSDPILSLRIVFNCLRDGCLLLLETGAAKLTGKYCRYGDRKDRESRIMSKPSTLLGGWAWFVPSLAALAGMMTDVGFHVRKTTLHSGNRALALGVRNQHVDMLRAGLSNPRIR